MSEALAKLIDELDLDIDADDDEYDARSENVANNLAEKPQNTPAENRPPFPPAANPS